MRKELIKYYPIVSINAYEMGSLDTALQPLKETKGTNYSRSYLLEKISH